MNTMTLVTSVGAIAGHGMAAFRVGTPHRPAPLSIGDQQARMALRACQRPAARATDDLSPDHAELLCLHCGAEMRLLEGQRLGGSLHLSAVCPRCGCLRATCVELTPASQRFLELPQEASFD
jgi:hypothetical protein